MNLGALMIACGFLGFFGLAANLGEADTVHGIWWLGASAFFFANFIYDW